MRVYIIRLKTILLSKSFIFIFLFITLICSYLCIKNNYFTTRYNTYTKEVKGIIKNIQFKDDKIFYIDNLMIIRIQATNIMKLVIMYI